MELHATRQLKSRVEVMLSSAAWYMPLILVLYWYVVMITFRVFAREKSMKMPSSRVGGVAA